MLRHWIPLRANRLTIFSLILWMLLFLMLALGVVGCSVLTPKVVPALAKGVNRYCQEPRDARLLLREQVNQAITPNSVQVNCAVDTPPPAQ